MSASSVTSVSKKHASVLFQHDVTTEVRTMLARWQLIPQRRDYSRLKLPCIDYRCNGDKSNQGLARANHECTVLTVYVCSPAPGVSPSMISLHLEHVTASVTGDLTSNTKKKKKKKQKKKQPGYADATPRRPCAYRPPPFPG